MNARPPADAGAEKRLITAIATAPELFRHAAEVQPSDFFDRTRSEAWGRLAQACKEASGDAPIITADYLEHYADDFLAVGAYVAEDARRILDARFRRDALAVAQRIAQAALVGEGLPDALRAAANVRTGAIQSTLLPIGEAVPAVIATIEDREARDSLILKTGLDKLDEALGGGLERKTSTVVMARPSMGKTALLVQLADLASERGLIVAVFSKEMSREQWARRMACRRARVNWTAVKEEKLTDEEWRRLSRELTAVNERANLYVDDSQPQTTEAAYRECERLADRLGRVDMIVADHMRLFSDRSDNETHRLGHISWQFKVMAKNLSAAAIVAAQLSRSVEGQSDKRPDLKDLRDSGEIEENADNVVALYREAYYQPGADDVAELIVRKARDGERNAGARYVFKPEWMSFERMAVNETANNQGRVAAAGGPRAAANGREARGPYPRD